MKQLLCYSLSIVKIRREITIPSKNMVDLYKTKKTKPTFITVHKWREKSVKFHCKLFLNKRSCFICIYIYIYTIILLYYIYILLYYYIIYIYYYVIILLLCTYILNTYYIHTKFWLILGQDIFCWSLAKICET